MLVGDAASLIGPIYSYLRSIGVSRKKPDLLITDTLKLVPKTDVHYGFFARHFACMRQIDGGSTHIPYVLKRVTTLLEELPRESSIYRQALFVQAALTYIASAQDSHLQSLSQLNQIDFFLDRASDQDREMSKKTVEDVERSYLDTGSIEECTDLLNRLKLSGVEGWQSRALPIDILAYILRLLPFSSYLSASQTCRRWHVASLRPSNIAHFFSHSRFMPFFDSLSDCSPSESIRQNRARVIGLSRGTYQETQLGCVTRDKVSGRFCMNELESLPNCTSLAIEDQQYFYHYADGEFTKSKSPHWHDDLRTREKFIIQTPKGVYLLSSHENAFTNTISLYEGEKITELHARSVKTAEYEVTFQCKHLTHLENELYITSQNGSLFVIDLKTKTCSFLKKLNARSVPEYFVFHYRLYFGTSGNLEIEDITHVSGKSRVLPNTKNFTIVTATPEIVYLSDRRTCIRAYSLVTGEELSRYEHPAKDAALARLEGGVSNGLLYIRTHPCTFYVADLLTRKHVCTMQVSQECGNYDFRVIANKILMMPKEADQRYFFIGAPIIEVRATIR